MSDEFVQQFLDDPETTEALAWLKAAEHDDSRSLGEFGSAAESIELVNRFYDAGAAEVLAVEIDDDDDYANTGKLVIKLPTETDRRGAVLSVAGEIAVSQGFDPEPDSGQSYVFVMLD